jgi:hypothetical protein
MPRLLVGRSDLRPAESWGVAQGATVRTGNSFHVRNSRTYSKLANNPSIGVIDDVPLWTAPGAGFAILVSGVTITGNATASVAPGSVILELYLIDGGSGNRVTLLSEIIPTWDSETTWTVNSDPGANTRFLASGGGATGGLGYGFGGAPLAQPTGSANEYTPLLVFPYTGSPSGTTLIGSDLYLGVRAANSCTITLPYRVDLLGMYFG